MSDKIKKVNLNSGSTLSKSVSMRANVDSLSLVKKEKIVYENKVVNIEVEHEEKKEDSSVDDSRRLFLKVAGVAGLGLAASALFPNQADAYIAGGAPTSNVVGSKDASNVRINPAKEDGNLASIKTNTDPLVASGAGGYIRQDSTATIAKESGGNLATIAAKDFATQATLALMKAQTDKLTFDVSNNLSTITGLKDALDNRITPAQDDSVILLRRIVKLMESQAVVDSGNRQRVTLDSLGTGTAITTTIPVSGTLTSAGTVSTVTSVTNIAALAGQNQQMYQDPARTAYANGIRQNLSFT